MTACDQRHWGRVPVFCSFLADLVTLHSLMTLPLRCVACLPLALKTFTARLVPSAVSTPRSLAACAVAKLCPLAAATRCRCCLMRLVVPRIVVLLLTTHRLASNESKRSPSARPPDDKTCFSLPMDANSKSSMNSRNKMWSLPWRLLHVSQRKHLMSPTALPHPATILLNTAKHSESRPCLETKRGQQYTSTAARIFLGANDTHGAAQCGQHAGHAPGAREKKEKRRPVLGMVPIRCLLRHA